MLPNALSLATKISFKNVRKKPLYLTVEDILDKELFILPNALLLATKTSFKNVRKKPLHLTVEDIIGEESSIPINITPPAPPTVLIVLL